MNTRAVGKRAYIRVERTQARDLSPVVAVIGALSVLALIVLFFFLTGAQEQAREDFMERLKKEKQIVEMNKALKMELFAITQKGYLEFAAQERLGLKRPKDEEVVVLR